MRLKCVATLCVVLMLGTLAAPARAQTATVSASYAAGWNMVGGPVGTDFSGATALFIYTPNGYDTAPSRQADLCMGYWAYFNTGVTLSLATPGANLGSSLPCDLQPGWNMIGNPFAGVALLPSGTIAFRWDPAIAAYRQVGSIPPGGAVWIYADSATSITLQQGPPNGSVVINGTMPGGPYPARVGDTVTVVLNGSFFVASSSSPLLRPVASGRTSGGSYFWSWKALAPGRALIDVSPRCLQATPPCAVAAPSRLIEVDIVA
jgi:hypothetical protein